MLTLVNLLIIFFIVLIIYQIFLAYFNNSITEGYENKDEYKPYDTNNPDNALILAQQNAGNISQQGMDSWLQNALGINSQYGQGQQNLMQGGQGAANSLMNMYSNMGNKMGDAAYGKEAGKQNDWWNMLGGVGGIIGSFL